MIRKTDDPSVHHCSALDRTRLGCGNAVWGAAECESVAAAAVNHQVAHATEAGLVFLWQAQSPGGCWQYLQGLASPQPLLAAPHQEWGRTLQAGVLEQQGRPGRGWEWELLQRQQLKWKSRLTTMLSSVCGDIYLLAALAHWYSPCFLEGTKSNIWWTFWRELIQLVKSHTTYHSDPLQHSHPQGSVRLRSLRWGRKADKRSQMAYFCEEHFLLRTIRISQRVRLNRQAFIRHSICVFTDEEDTWRLLW